MEKIYHRNKLNDKVQRTIIEKELSKTIWNMTVMTTIENGYHLEHPSFVGGVFGEFKNISSENRLQRGDHVEVEICVIKKREDYKFRVKYGKQVVPAGIAEGQPSQQQNTHLSINNPSEKKPSTAGPTQRIRLFIDESGDFSSHGHHLLATLCAIDNRAYPEFIEYIENRFKDLGNDYRTFHATDMGVRDRQIFFKAFVEKLSGKKIMVFMNTVELKKKPRFDIYFPLLVNSVLETIRILSDTHKKMNIEIYVEERIIANNKIFLNVIRENCFTNSMVAPALRILNFPKGENAMLSLVDLFSNIYFNDLKNRSNVFKPALSGWVTHFCKQNPSAITNQNAKEIIDRITKGETIKKITRTITKTITRVIQKEGKTVIVYDNTTISGRLIVEFDQRFRQNRNDFLHNRNEIFLKAYEKFSRNSLKDQLYEIEKIVDTIEELSETREFHFAAVLAEFITFHLEKAFETETEDIQRLKWFYIITISRWLASQNHLGEFSAEHSTVRKAEDFTKDFITDSDCWSEIAYFFNHISISYQNIFEFEKAAERIKPSVEYFSHLKDNPFGTGDITGRYIGGLFGCYSQSLFFYSHCSYHFTQGSQFEDLFEKAMSYSELSEIFFDDSKDIDRQYIYRAYGCMQKFILLGDKHSLEIAEHLLTGRFDRDELTRAFFENHKEISSNELYAFLAFLKLGWLSGKSDLSFPEQKYIIKIAGELPTRHPYEQILGYLILLKVIQGNVSNLMKDKPWPENIIHIIAQVFCLQIEWEKDKKLNPDLLEEMNILINERLMGPWKRYGIIEQLHATDQPGYRGIGPISVLPFNYS